jgi:hypothetical protein
MKRDIALAIASTFIASAAFAYQVTGPVVEVTPTKIVVEKGKEKWEIARDKDTKASGGDIQKGSRVTVEYKMHATSIEVKDGGKGAKKADKSADKSADKDKARK